jgi:hypothetical protein
MEKKGRHIVDQPSWYQKQIDKPLFPDVLWSRPETRGGRGKLLIIGGKAQEFVHVAKAYEAANKSGAGMIRVLVPESLRPFTKMLPNIEYAPSNPSGSFSRAALASFFDASAWADHVLLAGDLGKNSETTTLLDGYLLKCPSSVTISNDALGSISIPYDQLLRRPITLATDFQTLQKIAIQAGTMEPITSDIPQAKLAEILHEVTEETSGIIVAEHNSTYWAVQRGRVFSINSKSLLDASELSATSAVWRMQHNSKQLEAIVSSFIQNH